MVDFEANVTGDVETVTRTIVQRADTRRTAPFRNEIQTVVATTVAFAALAVFAMAPRPGDTTLLVVFPPGTSQSRIVESVGAAGARLLAFSALPFAVKVHVDGPRTIDGLRSRALLLASLHGLAGCARREEPLS